MAGLSGFWLALNKDGKLEVTKTQNGENPLVHGGWPLLGCNVWEHSYYIDYRNERPKYLEAWFDHINWDHVEEMYAQALGVRSVPRGTSRNAVVLTLRASHLFAKDIGA